MQLIIDDGTYTVIHTDGVRNANCFIGNPIGIFIEDLSYTIENDLNLSYDQLMRRDIVYIELTESQKSYPVWCVDGVLYRKQHRYITDYLIANSYLILSFYSCNDINHPCFITEKISSIEVEIKEQTINIGDKKLTINDIYLNMRWNNDFRKFMNAIKNNDILTFSNGGID